MLFILLADVYLRKRNKNDASKYHYHEMYSFLSLQCAFEALLWKIDIMEA